MDGWAARDFGIPLRYYPAFRPLGKSLSLGSHDSPASRDLLRQPRFL